MTHYPGPWHVDTRAGTTSVKASDGEIICDNERYYPQPLNPENANLIAAAPDLLAAIKNSDDAHWTTAMRAAMAKAEGRTP